MLSKHQVKRNAIEQALSALEAKDDDGADIAARLKAAQRLKRYTSD